MSGSTANKQFVTLTVGGRNLGTWQVAETPRTSADNQVDHLAGSGAQRNLGGLVTTENLTVSTLYENEVHQRNKAFLRNQVGVPGNAVVGIADLDNNNRPYGESETYRGMLVEYKGPDGDATSSDKRMIELVIAVDSVA